MKIDIYNTDKKYQVIYADPPWSYRQKGNARGTAVAHYDTMNTDDICNLPVKDIKTDDAILFMWATFPNLYDALKVINAWEFEYKTAAFVWVKTNKKVMGFSGEWEHTQERMQKSVWLQRAKKPEQKNK